MTQRQLEMVRAQLSIAQMHLLKVFYKEARKEVSDGDAALAMTALEEADEIMKELCAGAEDSDA